MSPLLVMCTGILSITSHVLTVGRHLHMLPLLLGKQPCLNFTVTSLFNLVGGIFELNRELRILHFAYGYNLIFWKEDTNAINDFVSIFVSREEQRVWCYLWKKTQESCFLFSSNTYTQLFGQKLWGPNHDLFHNFIFLTQNMSIMTTT